MNKKNTLISFSYWVLFLLLYQLILALVDDGGWLILYILVYPFLFVIPYVLLKVEKSQRIMFILGHFLLPLFIMYSIIIYDMLKSFKPSF